MTARRLSTGGRIDRARSLRFTWDGRTLNGHPGDTLASALMANGVRVVGRGFKYHRPRGIMSAGVEEGGALVTVGEGARRTPNARATGVELFEGLAARGQNAWPSVRFDLGAVNGLLGRFIGAGFYYKTFMGFGRGTATWMQFEKLIRRAAGFGAASRAADPDAYEIVHDHCDVLVVGAGPAGLSAAQTAAETGLDVILADQDFEPGGDLLGAAGPVGETDAETWRAARLAALAGVRLWTRATVFGLYDGAVAGVLERVTDHLARPDPASPRARLRIVRARRIVLATGALERPIAFGDNDRPGVMGAAAARIYARRLGVLPGQNIVVAATNDGAYADACALSRAGARVALADARRDVDAGLRALALAAGVEAIAGRVPVETYGRGGVRGVWLGRPLGGGWARPERDVAADIVAVSGGWSPALHLLAHRKARPVWSEAQACFLPPATDEPIHVCGAATGVWAADACAASGHAAGLAAAKALGAWGGAAPAAPPPGGWTTPIAAVFEVRVKGKALKSFVDPQHDVTAEDVRLAHREGFVSVEHMKRYTTLGMAGDQGKLGGVIGMAIMAEASGRSIAETGTTTFRPPYTPVPFGALAGAARGAQFRPIRRTPMHAEIEAADAVFLDAGLWRRAWYFPHGGEDMAQAAAREAAMVRTSVGVADISTLGKIAVNGPDAAAFLDRLYANAFATLPVGRARYGVMLREDGFVLDDGTAWRLSPTEFLVTTTTGEAAAVLKHVERLLQTRWSDLRAHATAVTEQWAGVSIAGPLSRETLAALAPGLDVSDAALPHMGVRETVFDGVPARIARLSFSGERAFEVFVPADHGPALWRAALAAARARGGGPYGLEALDILRIEKGHVTGREVDGRVTLDDLGMGRMASAKKPFVGSALRQRPEMIRPDRPRLVGLRPVAPRGASNEASSGAPNGASGATLGAGAVLCAPGAVGGHGVGWVSSVADSPHMGGRIALGFAAGGAEAWAGRSLIAADPVRGCETEVTVHPPCSFDPDGGRLHG